MHGLLELEIAVFHRLEPALEFLHDGDASTAANARGSSSHQFEEGVSIAYATCCLDLHHIADIGFHEANVFDGRP